MRQTKQVSFTGIEYSMRKRTARREMFLRAMDEVMYPGRAGVHDWQKFCKRLLIVHKR